MGSSIKPISDFDIGSVGVHLVPETQSADL